MLKTIAPLAAAMLAAGAAHGQAQTPTTAQSSAPAREEAVPLDQADIAVVLTARADHVRFHGPPQASIRLYAQPGGQVEAAYEPGLLPRIIRPTVTYSDIEVSYIGAALLAASEEPQREPPATPR